MRLREAGTSTPEIAGRREWLGLAVLVLPCVIVAMDVSVLYLASPEISTDLDPGSAGLLWIMDIYGFMLAGLLIIAGNVADRIGSRRMLLGGAACFAVVSALSAYTPNAGALIACRALLGVAGATLLPSTLSLIRNMFRDQGQRRTAIAVWTAGFAGGGVLGPMVGGVLLEHFWWGSVFLVNVPIMLVLLTLGWVLLPEFTDPSPGSFDLLGASLLLTATLCVAYGIKTTAEAGMTLSGVGAPVLGVVTGVLFIRRQRRAEDPLVDLRLFANRIFRTSFIVNSSAILVALGCGLFISQYLQLVLGLRPFESALWLLPGAIGLAAGSAGAATLARRTHPAAIISAGLFIMTAGFTLMAMSGIGDSPVVVSAAYGTISAGFGATSSLVVALIVDNVPPARAGAAAGLSETGSELGASAGVAVLGSLGAWIYRTQLGSSAPADHLGVARKVALDSLAGALSIASDNAAGEGLALAARRAFVSGMTAVGIVSAAICVVLAAVAGFALRDLSSGSDRSESQ
ncbi:MFS transporter [Aeromicrobium sp. 9AM]|uniref:MFS transporter n=1 Tax=Aeromicrobium sp. 9AM TaxID=2653126 RepID=UPI0012F1CCF4|nr:MFS transporter [Aeromicrobium sp. 9AM]VXB62731.1 MFS transporter [Aeromicrobium sp. 9AM]